MTIRENGNYVDAAGLRTYYEVSGEGEPLILLHGGMMTAETFDMQTPALASKYKVYLPERRGHGRTPDVEGPFTFEAMANDTIAFMDAVGLDSANLVGWSDGAIVAMTVAVRRPERVRKLVYIGERVTRDGLRPEAIEALNAMTLETAPPMAQQLYAVSPDGPEHFPVVFEKLKTLWVGESGLELSDLKAVTAPALVLLGDDDLITPEHGAAVQRALPDAQLAVVPGASHALVFEKPDLVNRLILDFLGDQHPEKMMPMSGGRH
ncbi:MAG: alpha/beta fold hydrolase [Actinomycetota bacterium]